MLKKTILFSVYTCALLGAGVRVANGQSIDPLQTSDMTVANDDQFEETNAAPTISNRPAEDLTLSGIFGRWVDSDGAFFNANSDRSNLTGNVRHSVVIEINSSKLYKDVYFSGENGKCAVSASAKIQITSDKISAYQGGVGYGNDGQASCETSVSGSLEFTYQMIDEQHLKIMKDGATFTLIRANQSHSLKVVERFLTCLHEMEAGQRRETVADELDLLQNIL